MSGRYAIFDGVVRCDRTLPFPSASSREPDVDVRRRPGLVDEVDRESLGELTADPDRCAVVRGEWVFEFGLDRGELSYAEVDWGQYAFPLHHLLERELLPLWWALTGEDRLALHGGAVLVGDRAWLFVGEKGAGKSTTVYQFVRRHGAAALSDETAVVDLDRGQALPGRPAVRLRRSAGSVPEAVEEGAVHEELDKRWFRLDDRHYTRRVASLAGILVLRQGGEIGDCRALSGSEALGGVLEQACDFSAGSPDWWKRRRFRNARRLAEGTPVYEVWRGQDGDVGDPTDLLPLA